MSFLLDTGILLRLPNRNDPEHQNIHRAMRAIKQEGDEMFTLTQNIAEFWSVCTRPTSARGGYGLSIPETEQRLRLIERLVSVLSEHPNAHSAWKRLVIDHVVSGVQVHDARLVASMHEHGISNILTLNGKDFARYSGITVSAPADIIQPPT